MRDVPKHGQIQTKLKATTTLSQIVVTRCQPDWHRAATVEQHALSNDKTEAFQRADLVSRAD